MDCSQIVLEQSDCHEVFQMSRRRGQPRGLGLRFKMRGLAFSSGMHQRLAYEDFNFWQCVNLWQCVKFGGSEPGVPLRRLLAAGGTPRLRGRRAPRAAARFRPCLRALLRFRFRVQGSGSGFRVQGSGSGFRVQGSGFRVQGAGCRVQGSGFRVQGSYRQRAG